MSSTLQLNSRGLASFKLPASFNHPNSVLNGTISFPRIKLFRALVSSTEIKSDPQETPLVDIAFVHSVLLPDGTPDVHYRRIKGGQTLRDIMLDNNIDLYGPNARPLLNCAGGGTCATCKIEVIGGDPILNPRTDKEKEKLKKKPKHWRLACQTIVGTPNSTGMVAIQQLPEWKAHEWKYEPVLDTVTSDA